jgi:hypothetical protein
LVGVIVCIVPSSQGQAKPTRNQWACAGFGVGTGAFLSRARGLMVFNYAVAAFLIGQAVDVVLT